MASLGYKLCYNPLFHSTKHSPPPYYKYQTPSATDPSHQTSLLSFASRFRLPHAAVPAAGSKDEGVPRRFPSFLTADLPLPFKHNFGPHFPQPSHHFSFTYPPIFFHLKFQNRVGCSVLGRAWPICNSLATCSFVLIRDSGGFGHLWRRTTAASGEK